MKINKYILFTPLLGLLYALLLTFIEHDRPSENLKVLSLLYHITIIILIGMWGQHLHIYK